LFIVYGTILMVENPNYEFPPKSLDELIENLKVRTFHYTLLTMCGKTLKSRLK